MPSVSIGGCKGHINEVVTDPLFMTLFTQFRWKMIPNCTGRYTCRDHKQVSSLPPLELLEVAKSTERNDLDPYYFTFDATHKDPIIVIPFSNEGTGLISYIKPNKGPAMDSTSAPFDLGNLTNYYVHTLNSPSGFQRKLDAIGVVLSSDCILK